MLKVVIDTNVVISALIKPESKPELVLMLAFGRGLAQLYVSDDIFTEYRGVLNYGKFKKYLSASKIKKILLQIKKHGKWVKPNVSVEATTDPEDSKFLECALKAKADFVVTGNIKHFPSKKFHDTRIVTPSQFLEIVAKILFK